MQPASSNPARRLTGRPVRRRRTAVGEQGFLIIWMALLLAVLLGCAALVVDLGFARNKRQQYQGAADAAALGSAQDLPDLGGAAGQINGLVTANVPEAQIDWASCSDPNHLEIVSSTSQCVSFDSSFTRVRVAIPSQQYPTLFGKALLVDSIGVSAQSVAQFMNAGLDAVMPFGLYAGNDTEACLKTGGNTPEPLCNAMTGNFGTLDITMYGNASIHTVQRCGNSQQSARLENNIAIGADHIFSVYDDADGQLLDACGQAGPNTLPTRTGDVQGSFDLGILHGTAATFDDGGPARLARGPFTKTEVAGVGVDNQPLWEFIPDVTLTEVPNSCQRATFDALVSATPSSQAQTVLHDAVETCLADYDSGSNCSAAPCTGTLFTVDSIGTETPINVYDIQQSPRFVFAPEFAEASPPNGNGSFRIVGFAPVFLQRLLVKCTSSSCRADFEPGPWNTSALGAANDMADAITAFVLNPNMLASGIRQPYVIGSTAYVQLIM